MGIVAEKLEKVTASLSGERMLKIELHAGQERVKRELLDGPARFVCFPAHRRWGKNFLCIYDALEQSRRLAGQKRGLNPEVMIWFVVPNYTLAEELWTDLKRMVPRTDCRHVSNSKPYSIDLHNGTHIAVRSADHPDDLVSAGIDLLYMVEAARMSEVAWLTVRPTLVSQGRLGRAVFNSTPKGENWFSRIWRMCQDPAQPAWQGMRIPAYAADGSRHELSIMPEEEKLEEERRSYPDRWFRQEYMAEFLSGEGAVFRSVRERIAPPPCPPQSPIVAGVDVAKHRDFTVCTAFDGRGRMLEMERMQQLPYAQQAERICGFLIRNRVEKVVVEGNGPGDPFCEMLERDMYDRAREFPTSCRLVPFVTTAPNKRQMIDKLVVAFERATITILDDPQLVNEFEAFSMVQTASGHERFSAPEGGFDDCVMSCALAWTEAGTPAVVMAVPSEQDMADLNIGTWWKIA